MACNDYFRMTDGEDSFQTWQGLRGPAGEPGPAGPPGPPGSSVELRGPVASTDELPETASSSELWQVGTSTPYDGWFYNGSEWENAGPITAGPPGPTGPTGPQGPAGPAGADGQDGATFTPSVSSSGVISWTNDGGLPNPPSVNIKGQDGAAGVGVPEGGSTGQVLKKRSGTNYDTEWANESGGGGGIGYGVCTEAATTAAKTVTISGVNALTTGLGVRVLFENGNSIASPTLNVNSLGAAAIRTSSGTSYSAFSDAGGVLDLVYDGTAWLIVTGGIATTSAFGRARLNNSVESDIEITAPTSRAIYRLANGMIAPVYSASSTYAVGDRVRYGYKLYECSTAIASPEIWNSAHWTELDPLADLAHNPEVSVISNPSTTLTLLPCPVTYVWGEVAALTLTVTATTQYHFMFTCPSAYATVLTLNGITGTAGDTIEAGKTYEVDIWAGIALISGIEVTPAT